MGARETALNALMACRREGAWSNGVLKDYSARDRLDPRDAALAARLCYGVLQNRQKLDFYLQQLLRCRLKDLHPAVRDVLHLGLYQILEMDKIPPSAAVNESVELAKKYGKNPRAGALVNGVLRSAVRDKAQLRQPESWADRYSHPEELIALLKKNLPKGKVEGMLIADNQAPPMTVQVNLTKTDRETLAASLEEAGVTVKSHSWLENCLVLEHTGSIENLEAFRKGWFYVQDPASRLSVICARSAVVGGRVLDCCAAPGGKSFAAAIDRNNTGEVISCDIHPHKAQLIQNGAQRLGLTAIRSQCRDATVFEPAWEGAFDTVITDVPCSGLGIIRKKPDIRYKDLKAMEELPQLQLRILENQSRYVKPGGVLLYSTCTVLQRENEDVVRAFLAKHPEFATEALPLPKPFPENDTGMLTLIPGEYDTDGFFICRLRRKSCT